MSSSKKNSTSPDPSTRKKSSDKSSGPKQAWINLQEEVKFMKDQKQQQTTPPVSPNVSPLKRSYSYSSPIIAYVESVSKEKRNKQDTRDYSNVSLQLNGQKKERALCFSKTKRALLLERQTNKTAVKIANFNRAKDEARTIYINDMTTIVDAPMQEYCFQFDDEEAARSTTQTKNIANIISSSQEMDLVNTYAKVLQIGPVEITKLKHMSLADSLIADGSGHIKLTLWQDNIKGCNNNQAYHFTELRVRIDNEVKFLSTTKETVITPINDPALTNLAVEGLSSLPLAIYTTVTVPFIHSIQDCQWIKNCTSCGKKIIQVNSGFLLQCDFCKHRVRSESCSTSLMIHFVIETPEDKDNNKQTLTVFQDVLEKVLGKDITSTDEDTICKELMELSNIAIEYHTKKNTVTDIKKIA